MDASVVVVVVMRDGDGGGDGASIFQLCGFAVPVPMYVQKHAHMFCNAHNDE